MRVMLASAGDTQWVKSESLGSQGKDCALYGSLYGNCACQTPGRLLRSRVGWSEEEGAVEEAESGERAPKEGRG